MKTIGCETVCSYHMAALKVSAASFSVCTKIAKIQSNKYTNSKVKACEYTHMSVRIYMYNVHVPVRATWLFCMVCCVFSPVQRAQCGVGLWTLARAQPCSSGETLFTRLTIFCLKNLAVYSTGINRLSDDGICTWTNMLFFLLIITIYSVVCHNWNFFVDG